MKSSALGRYVYNGVLYVPEAYSKTVSGPEQTIVPSGIPDTEKVRDMHASEERAKEITQPQSSIVGGEAPIEPLPDGTLKNLDQPPNGQPLPERDDAQKGLDISSATLNIANATVSGLATGEKAHENKPLPQPAAPLMSSIGAEIDKLTSDKTPKERLRDRLQQTVTTDSVRESWNELRASSGRLRDTMYLDDASPREWESGYNRRKEKINASKQVHLNAVVNNENNVKYMQEVHGLGKEAAKERLKSGSDFVAMGVTNVKQLDRLIEQRKPGQTAAQTVIHERLAPIGGAIKNARVQNIITNPTNVAAVTRLIAGPTGDTTSPRVQHEAKVIMEQAKPFALATGEKNPTALFNYVQLFKKLGLPMNDPKTVGRVLGLDRYIDRAMHKGIKRFAADPSSSPGRKKLVDVMNEVLGDRRNRSLSEGSTGKKGRKKKTD